MNKKIILLIAVLLIVAIVFVACKGKGDVEETPKATVENVKDSETKDENNADTNKEEITLGTGDIVFFEEDRPIYSEDDLYFGDEPENERKEDQVSWDEIVGKNS